MMETQEEKQARVEECAKIIMEYTGNQYGMRTAKNVLNRLDFTVEDIFWVPYEDGTGSYRLWTIKLPNGLENVTWQQKMVRDNDDGHPGETNQLVSCDQRSD